MNVTYNPLLLSVGSIVGIEHNGETEMFDGLGIIKTWTQDHANVWILNSTYNKHLPTNESQKSWIHLFFCLPWNYSVDIFSFKFTRILMSVFSRNPRFSVHKMNPHHVTKVLHRHGNYLQHTTGYESNSL